MDPRKMDKLFTAPTQETEEEEVDNERFSRHERLVGAVWSSVDALTPKQALAVRLRYGGPLSQREIARIIGTAQQNVMMLLKRAHRTLRKKLFFVA